MTGNFLGQPPYFSSLDNPNFLFLRATTELKKNMLKKFVNKNIYVHYCTYDSCSPVSFYVLYTYVLGGRIFDNLQIDNLQIDNRQIDNHNLQIDNRQITFFARFLIWTVQWRIYSTVYSKILYITVHVLYYICILQKNLNALFS